MSPAQWTHTEDACFRASSSSYACMQEAETSMVTEPGFTGGHCKLRAVCGKHNLIDMWWSQHAAVHTTKGDPAEWCSQTECTQGHSCVLLDMAETHTCFLCRKEEPYTQHFQPYCNIAGEKASHHKDVWERKKYIEDARHWIATNKIPKVQDWEKNHYRYLIRKLAIKVDCSCLIVVCQWTNVINRWTERGTIQWL